MSDMNLDLAPGWQPEPGDVVIGEVVDVSRSRSSFNEQSYYPIITIRLTSGGARTKDSIVPVGENIAIHCFHGVLKARIVELRPMNGEILGVKYVKASEKNPKGKGKDANTPHVYNARVQGRSVDVYAGMTNPYDDTTATKEPRTAPVSDVPDDDDIPF